MRTGGGTPHVFMVDQFVQIKNIKNTAFAASSKKICARTPFPVQNLQKNF